MPSEPKNPLNKDVAHHQHNQHHQRGSRGILLTIFEYWTRAVSAASRLCPNRRSAIKRSALALGLVVIGVLLAQCSPNTTTPVDPTFTSLYNNFFYPTCVNCHRSGGSGPTFKVDDMVTAYNSLNEYAQGIGSSGCSNLKLVQPKSPQQSFVMLILSQDYTVNGCSPYSEHHTNLSITQAFTSDVQQALVQWITNGALQD